MLFETPVHAELLEKTGVRTLITAVIDELVTIARAQGCDFPAGFREQVMEKMITSSESNSIMYQDFLARRPLEVETYLGSPIKLAQEVGLQVPRIETLYALLHNLNTVNQNRPQQAAPASPTSTIQPTPRMSSAPPGNGVAVNGRGPGPMNGHVNGYGPGPMNGPMRGGMRPGGRVPSSGGMPPPPSGMRRGPPSMTGFPASGPGRMNGYGPGPRAHPQQMSRRGSFEGNDLEEFSHLMLYDNVPDGEHGGFDGVPASASGDLTLRERELALRQKELAIREREYHMRRGGPRMPPPPVRESTYDDDDEDGEEFFDPMAGGAVPGGVADNIDMMSVTSRRTRKAPSASQLRSNPEMMGGAPPGGMRHSRGPPMRRPGQKNRTSSAMMNDMPSLREELMNNPLMGYSSDRYGNVDRMNMGHESRANSLTAERLSEIPHGGPPNGYPPHNGYPMHRRGSQSPGNPLGPPNGRPMQRPSPPNGFGPPGRNGRPSPPAVRQPVPHHPPGHGNAVAPQQIEQQSGVSNLYPPKSGPPNQVRSLTGSASASAGSGDSNRSAPIDSEPSAHSSSSSLHPGAPIGVR